MVSPLIDGTLSGGAGWRKVCHRFAVVRQGGHAVRDGKIFSVVAHNNSKDNIYVQSARLNGRKYTKSYVDFPDIVAGGTLELFMGSKPSKFGTSKKDRP